MSESFEGLNQVIKDLESVANEKDVKECLGKACALVERSARLKAPRDTGALRRSISSKVEDDEAIVFTPLEYAPYVEYGTMNNRAQPFLEPSLEENRSEIVEMFSKLLKGGK